MLFSVDFSIRVNESFQTVHWAFIPAESVTECREVAQEIKANLPESQKHQVHIFIEQ
ncbi:hypothetical protein ACFRCQ_08375 [Cytobacillus firmus]|uniref:hypothetical protein n=1 Tax=Cytobacillus firmus TaxID=1399 RepID=UPI0036A1B39F